MGFKLVEFPGPVYDILKVLYKRPYLKNALLSRLHRFAREMLPIALEKGLIEKKNVALGKGKKIRTYYVLTKAGCDAIGAKYEQYAPRAVGAHNYFTDVAKDVYGEDNITRTFLFKKSKPSVIQKLDGDHNIVAHLENDGDYEELNEELPNLLDVEDVDGILLVARNDVVAEKIREHIIQLPMHFYWGAISLMERDEYYQGKMKTHSDFIERKVWERGVRGEIKIIKIAVKEPFDGIGPTRLGIEAVDDQNNLYTFRFLHQIRLISQEGVEEDDMTQAIPVGWIKCQNCRDLLNFGQKEFEPCRHMKWLFGHVLENLGDPKIPRELGGALIVKAKDIYSEVNEIKIQEGLTEKTVYEITDEDTKHYLCLECKKALCRHIWAIKKERGEIEEEKEAAI